MSVPGDPREADTLDHAARNPDGTYNGLRAMSWLSEVLRPGHGFSVEQIEEIAAEAKARVARTKGSQ